MKKRMEIHNMGKGCPYCTLWADGFNGVAKHLEAFNMASAHGTSFAKDLGFQAKDGSYRPGVSVFRKQKNGMIVRVSKAQFGPGDDFCSVWHLFDLLPRGRTGWEPKFTY